MRYCSSRRRYCSRPRDSRHPACRRSTAPRIPFDNRPALSKAVMAASITPGPRPSPSAVNSYKCFNARALIDRSPERRPIPYRATPTPPPEHSAPDCPETAPWSISRRTSVWLLPRRGHPGPGRQIPALGPKHASAHSVIALGISRNSKPRTRSPATARITAYCGIANSMVPDTCTLTVSTPGSMTGAATALSSIIAAARMRTGAIDRAEVMTSMLTIR